MNFRLARAYNLNANSTISNASAVKAGEKIHTLNDERGWRGNHFYFTAANLSSSNSNHIKQTMTLCVRNSLRRFKKGKRINPN